MAVMGNLWELPRGALIAMGSWRRRWRRRGRTVNSPNHREHPDGCQDHGSYAVYGAPADIMPNTVRLKAGGVHGMLLTEGVLCEAHRR